MTLTGLEAIDQLGRELPAWVERIGARHGPEHETRLASLVQQVKSAWVGESSSAVREALERSLQTTEVLASLEVDVDCLTAALAGTLPQYTRDHERAREKLGGEAAALVERLQRAKQIELLAHHDGASGKSEASKLESLRKMVLAMAQDVRVVIIQLADRLCQMRRLTKSPEELRREAGRITMDLYAPLANRLGVWQLKWELEDLAFRFLEPVIYKDVARLLDEKRIDREGYIERVIAELRAELERNQVAAEVVGRPKHIYSIYKKMQRKRLEFEDLHDVRGLRALVKDVKDCYSVLGVVHGLWQPIPGEFDDYIAHPKGNLYRSLHTAVIGPEDKTLEVQIRTYDMHHDSELGIAAHWRYKEGVKADRKYQEKIAWLRQILDWQDEITHARGPGDDYTQLFQDTIYVLTPQGQIIDLPQGATPVDFAYHVHTDLGHRCRGAKVDGNIVPLSYRLKNAQRVEITSAKQGGPSRDWLNPELGYLVSARAQAKVRAWFKQQHWAEAISAGRTALEKEMQRAGQSGLAMEKIAQALKFSKTDDLLAAIGHSELTSRQLQQAIQSLVETPAPTEPLPPTELTRESKASSSAGGVVVLGVNNIATLIAKCCKPVPPEPIIGFVTKGRGVVVHRTDCDNVRSLDRDRRDRLMPADWGAKVSGPFSVDIAIDAQDRGGLLRDISDVMAREHINVTAVNTLSRGDRARMFFTVELGDLGKLNQLLVALKAVPSVDSAARKRG